VFEIANEAALLENLNLPQDQFDALKEGLRDGVQAGWQRGIPPGFVVDGIQIKRGDVRGGWWCVVYGGERQRQRDRL
jgi:hypothetical protein